MGGANGYRGRDIYSPYHLAIILVGVQALSTNRCWHSCRWMAGPYTMRSLRFANKTVVGDRVMFRISKSKGTRLDRLWTNRGPSIELVGGYSISWGVAFSLQQQQSFWYIIFGPVYFRVWRKPRQDDTQFSLYRTPEALACIDTGNNPSQKDLEMYRKKYELALCAS